MNALGVAPARGLSANDAAWRLIDYGPNRWMATRRRGDVALFLSQFTSPIILVLLAAAVLAFFLGDRSTAVLILLIVLGSGALGFWQERAANEAVAKLLAIVEVRVAVLRDGARVEVSAADIVPGDILLLSAGEAIAGDAILLSSKELFVDESTLTGETFPVEKETGAVPPDTPLLKRTGALFMGTHVLSGSGAAVVVRTGAATEFGKISRRLAGRAEETEFEHGIRRFGYFLTEVALVLVLALFGVNVYLHKPVLDSFLFSLALAIGITPQLLPAILSVSLARGARRMAEAKVVIKRLTAIEDFGAMDILCADKTGTLTEGVVRFKQALDPGGDESEEVHRWAFLNACFQSGYANPIDDAIRASGAFDRAGWRKVDEEPYDFARKRLSVLLERDGQRVIVTKGAFAKVLEVSTRVRLNGETRPIDGVTERLGALYQELSSQGFRMLGVALRENAPESPLDTSAEREMTFLGVIVLHDPPRSDARSIIEALTRRGVRLKIITGDNALIAGTVGAQMGLDRPRILTGGQLSRLSDLALARLAPEVDVFAEVEPNQKEDIIRALRAAGHVVGYLGDGINDASALHAADVGISVNTAADVAKEAASIVLLEKDLAVLARGVEEGRVTFANTLKYILMASSGNFGNMISMAGASLFLPFLPLLPAQILLGNLLTDLPAMTISTDGVDPELVRRPRRWNVRFIRDFMLAFGPINSAMDYITFAVLLLVLRVDEVGFHTMWFVENVFTAALIVLVVRTRRPFWRSRPAWPLTIASLAVVALTLALPFSPLAQVLGFQRIPLPFIGILLAILLVYIIAAEAVKRLFYHDRHADQV